MENISKDLKPHEEFYFQWHITDQCNLRCKHCYYENYQTHNELSLSEMLCVVDHIEKTVTKWGRLASLSITGGEPLVRLDELRQLIQYMEEKPHIQYFDLLTNGTLLDQSCVDFLLLCKKLRRVQLSLEGSNPEKNDLIRGEGSFQRIIQGIDLLKSYRIPVSLMVTLTKTNFDDISQIVNLAVNLGIDYLSFERFIPEGSGRLLKNQVLSREEIKYAYELIYRLSRNEKRIKILTYRPLFALCGDDPHNGAMCSVGTNALTIMHDGTVYPCRRLPIPLGNILKDGLFKIWYDAEILWEIRNCRNLKGKCKDCHLIPACRGCRAMAYFVNGDYLAEDPQCWK